MKKVYGFLLILLIVCQGNLPGEKVTVLNEVKAPSGFYLHGDHLYIVEFPLVYDYSLKDFHLLKKFGKQGEGPGEWLRFARLHFHPDYFIIQSQTRFSYYNLDWKYLKDEKVSLHFDRGVQLMGDRFVVSHTDPGKNDPNQTDLVVNIYDSNFKKTKEVYRQKYYFQVGKPVNGIYLAEDGRRTGIRFSVRDNKIYIEGEDGETGNIYVYDNQGQKIDTLHLEFEKLKVTAEHKKAVEDYYKLRHRRLFDIVKARGWLSWPDYFPAVRYVGLVDNRFFVIPYMKKQGKNQLFIFDLKGKPLKQVDMPEVEETMFSFYPFAIQDGKLYRLVENQDEEWELHVTEIE